MVEAIRDEGARISQRAGYEKGDGERRVQEKNDLEGLLFAVGASCLVYHVTLLIPSIPKRRRNPSGFRPCSRPAACAQALQQTVRAWLQVARPGSRRGPATSSSSIFALRLWTMRYSAGRTSSVRIVDEMIPPMTTEIGRASCRERVCQYV